MQRLGQIAFAVVMGVRNLTSAVMLTYSEGGGQSARDHAINDIWGCSPLNSEMTSSFDLTILMCVFGGSVLIVCSLSCVPCVVVGTDHGIEQYALCWSRSGQ
jgi:hypothetical protein